MAVRVESMVCYCRMSRSCSPTVVWLGKQEMKKCCIGESICIYSHWNEWLLNWQTLLMVGSKNTWLIAPILISEERKVNNWTQRYWNRCCNVSVPCRTQSRFMLSCREWWINSSEIDVLFEEILRYLLPALRVVNLK